MIHYSDYNYEELSKLMHRKVWHMEHRGFAGETKFGRYIMNIPFSFDIETSYLPKFNRSIMYIWQFGINGTAVYGRTWEEFKDFLSRFKNALRLCDKKYAVVYIHNAGYEFEFLHSILKLSNIFARSTHNPIYFDCDEYCIQFRDSYILSGLSLEKTAENLTKHKIEKLDGDKFNYNLIRHSNTELKDYELKYCENDVLILNYFIQEEMDYCGDLSKVPLTRTGYARRRFRSALHKDKEFWFYWHMKIAAAYPSVEEFCLLNKCFMGGYVHANCQYVGFGIEDVTSIDFASSYPAQMVRHKFPLSSWTKIDPMKLTINKLEKELDRSAAMMEIVFLNIKSKTQHHIISKSKCAHFNADAIFDNGRLVEAELIHTFITDVDYKIIKMFYRFKAIKVIKLFTNKYEYLPTPFIAELLNLYEIKTQLKNVDGKEEEYQRAKGDINAAYGMLCQNPVTGEVKFSNGEWEVTPEKDINIEEVLYKNKKSKSYFMPYCVGVWVTAWARYELLRTVYEIDKNDEIGDVIYNDTDSIKLINYDTHKSIIEEYNKKTIEEINLALKFHGIDENKVRPKTIEGYEKQLGIFEIDAKYPLFKTLGCKRYCYIDKKNEFHYTASGIPKGKPKEYMENEAKRKKCHIFDIFDIGLSIPSDYSQKLTHYCFNDRKRVNVTDYCNNTEFCKITSCCVLIPQPYKMASNKDFINFLKGHQLHRQFETETPLIGSRHELLKVGIFD